MWGGMKHLLFFLVLSFGLSLPAKSSMKISTQLTAPIIDLFVVNGEKSSQDSIHAKHVVMLTNSSSCSGTIISESAILTAAHCENSFGTIHFGMGNVTKPVQYKAVHADYDKQDKLSPDIAIIFFEGGLPEGFEPMPLATEMDIVSKAEEVFVAGFGQDIAKRIGQLKHFKSLVLEDSFVDQGLLIIDNDEQGHACFGDSGGTSYIVEGDEAVLVGVNSNIGPKFQDVLCKTEFMISAYVPYHIDWIEAQLQNYERVTSGNQ